MTDVIGNLEKVKEANIDVSIDPNALSEEIGSCPTCKTKLMSCWTGLCYILYGIQLSIVKLRLRLPSTLICSTTCKKYPFRIINASIDNYPCMNRLKLIMSIYWISEYNGVPLGKLALLNGTQLQVWYDNGNSMSVNLITQKYSDGEDILFGEVVFTGWDV